MRKIYKLTDKQTKNMSFYLFAHNQMNNIYWVKELGTKQHDFDDKMQDAWTKHCIYRDAIEAIIKEAMGKDYIMTRETTSLNEISGELTIIWSDDEK